MIRRNPHNPTTVVRALGLSPVLTPLSNRLALNPEAAVRAGSTTITPLSWGVLTAPRDAADLGVVSHSRSVRTACGNPSYS